MKRQATATVQPTRFIFFLLLLVTAACLSGCGYTLSSGKPTVLGSPENTLKVKGVENPTQENYLGFVLRNQLRDEIGARNVATWVDSGNSDYSIQIRVLSFNMREMMHDDDEISMFFNGTLAIEAFVYKGEDNSVEWRSGRISYTNTYDIDSKESAANELSRQVIRRLVDRMRSDF